jgi:hypothetical protein
MLLDPSLRVARLAPRGNLMPLSLSKGQRHEIAEPVPSEARNLLRSSIFLPIGRLSGLPMGKKTAMTLCAAA